MSDAYEVRPFLPIRRAYRDLLAAARSKSIIHGLVEVDVTEPRRVLRLREAAGEDLSFTAFLVHAVATAVDQDRLLHAYRRHAKLIIYDDIDVNTQIEAVVNGQHIVKPLIMRAANRKSVEELSAEIRAGQQTSPPSERRYRTSLLFLKVPRPLRMLAWRVLMTRPDWWKKLGGTVALSSVGMFGPRGGWGIPVTPATLSITVGGIVTEPRYVHDALEPREVCDLTISVDHEIVDGAPAARFARRLAELIEQADGLQAQPSEVVGVAG